MVSSVFLRMCPEAAPRRASPAATKLPPAAIQAHAGRANHKYAAAKIKPSGTRRRVAIRAQLGMAASQKVARGGNHFLGADLQQAFIRLAVMRERGLAFWMPQSNRPGAERTSARRIGGAEEGDHGNAQRCGQMSGTGIATESDARAAGECDELSDGAVDCKSVSAAGFNHRLGQSFFPWGRVHHRFQVGFGN